MELMWEPRKLAMNKVTKVKNEPEMTEFESAFVCGMIKTRRPKKIVEIGVAAGGTTAIILQCIDLLKMNDDCEFVSIDLGEKFYRNKRKNTGFLGAEIKDKLNAPVNHRFLLGKVLADRIEELGGGIDLVILDTVHCLPGEVLDFPVLLPFLSDNAVVILHDIACHLYGSKEEMATQVLLDAVTGDKIVPMGMDKERPSILPNIGAVQVNEDTKQYIESVFHAMLLPWHYLPKENELASYRSFYEKYYGKSLAEIFDTAIELNRNLMFGLKNAKMSYKERIRWAGIVLIKGHR